MGWMYQLVEGTMGQCINFLPNLIDVFENPKRIFEHVRSEVMENK